MRFLDAFVASLDVAALGFAKARCAATGSPPYDPAMLLKLYLYGYLHRVRSSRLLEAECQRNVEVIWLTGKQAPDHKTIADFRKDNVQPFQAVHRQFRLLCHKLNLFGAQLAGLDGTKVNAVNSKDANFNEAKLRELIQRADAQLAEYVNALDAADAAGPEDRRLSRAELEAKIAALQEKRDWHEELLGQLDAEQKQISVSDPDARRMRAGSGSVVGYNAQAAVDHQNKLIVAEDVTNEETDLRQLSGMAKEAKANLGVGKLEVVADTGYCTTAQVAVCEQHGITAYVPQADTSANTKQGLFGKSRFTYDAPEDVYVCPAEKMQLTYRFNTYELGRELRYYRASGCKACALENNAQEQGQPDDHAGAGRSGDGGDGGASPGTPGEAQTAQAVVRTSLRDDQAVFRLHLLPDEGADQSTGRIGV